VDDAPRTELSPAGVRSEVSRDLDDRMTAIVVRRSYLPGMALFDTLRVRVSARPGRHSA